MELRQIESFLKIAEYENITRAAETLHMSQPPLTRQLQALEEELGVQLFVREKKRLHITEEGRFFRQQCGQILALVEKTKEQLRQMSEGLSGTVYIGATETTGAALLPAWIEGARARWPAVRYSLWSANSDDVMERLEKGLLDMGLILEPFNGERFEAVHIMDEPWAVLARTDHPLASARQVTLEELTEEELIVPIRRSGEIARWFQDAGLQADITCQYAPLMNGIMLVERGLGVAICPASAGERLGDRPLALVPLAEPHPTGISLVWQKGVRLSAAAEQFAAYVADLYR